MSVDPTAPASADRAISDPAQLVATDITAAPVTVGEIAKFLRHLTDLRVSDRSDDPAARAAFLHRKAELFGRLAADPALSAAPAPRRGTP